MIVRFTLLWLGSFLLTTGHADELKKPITRDEMRELFTWFDRLPLTDVEGLKFVKVWTGTISTKSTGEKMLDTTEGFLLRDDGKKFRIVNRDWNLIEFEKQTLIDRVQLGGTNAAEFAQVLLSRYPDDAEKTIISMASSETEDRSKFIELLATRTSARCRDFFAQELRESSRIESRIAAAEILRDQGDTEAVKHMINYWNLLPNQLLEETNPVQEMTSEPGRPPSGPPKSPVLELTAFLLSSNDPEAIEAVGKRLQELSEASKLVVIQQILN